MQISPIYYQVDIDQLPKWQDNSADLLGYYFVFKRRNEKGKLVMREAINVVPVYRDGTGTEPDGDAAELLKDIGAVMTKRRTKDEGRPVKDPSVDYLYQRLQGYPVTGRTKDRTGYVLLTYADLAFFKQYATTILVSGCVIDQGMFMDPTNPEYTGRRANRMFSLKVEGLSVELAPPPNVRTPFLLAAPCRRKWYTTQ